MTELEQLRADLATIQEAAKIAKTLGYPDRSGNYDMVESELKEKIADLEAQQATADEWAGVKVIIADWLNHPYNTHIQGIPLKKFANYVHHLESKVAELEHELRCERIDGGKVRDDRKAISTERNRQKLAELTTILNAIPPACGLARELVERRIQEVKKEMLVPSEEQGNG